MAVAAAERLQQLEEEASDRWHLRLQLEAHANDTKLKILEQQVRLLEQIGMGASLH